jgi:hypothetical protein
MDIAASRRLTDDKVMRKSVSPVLLALVLALFLVPPLYVVSAGPAIWCHDRGIISQRAMTTCYWPVSWTIEHVPIVGRAVNSYCLFWYTPEKQRQGS